MLPNNKSYFLLLYLHNSLLPANIEEISLKLVLIEGCTFEWSTSFYPKKYCHCHYITRHMKETISRIPSSKPCHLLYCTILIPFIHYFSLHKQNEGNQPNSKHLTKMEAWWPCLPSPWQWLEGVGILKRKIKYVRKRKLQRTTINFHEKGRSIADTSGSK